MCVCELCHDSNPPPLVRTFTDVCLHALARKMGRVPERGREVAFGSPSPSPSIVLLLSPFSAVTVTRAFLLVFVFHICISLNAFMRCCTVRYECIRFLRAKCFPSANVSKLIRQFPFQRFFLFPVIRSHTIMGAFISAPRYSSRSGELGGQRAYRRAYSDHHTDC